MAVRDELSSTRSRTDPVEGSRIGGIEEGDKIDLIPSAFQLSSLIAL